MPLEQQIQSIVVSISYGLFFSFLFNLSYAKICKLSKVLKFIISILFLLINTTIYFYFLYLVNNGIIHIYFLMALYIGFVIGNTKTKIFRYKYK